MNRVCIMGLGYIGLPTAIVAAEHNYNVIGFDIDTKRVDRINNHDPVIQEPEIFSRLGKVLHKKTFKAVSTIQPSDYFVIAVPTPFKKGKKADLSYIWRAADILAPILQIGNIVILESTIPVGTIDTFAKYLAQKTNLKAGIDFFVAHCPERVLPGNIFYELVHNARVIGGINEQSTEHALIFYRKFVQAPLHTTSAKAAEMVKLVENSSRDVAVAFANEVANIAYASQLNPFEIIELANKHPRVSILQPSCGVGGHCIAVDPWFLVETFPNETPLIQAARYVNDTKTTSVANTISACIKKYQKNNTQTLKVLILGLTYKQDIDDLRESPALTISQKLAQRSDIQLLICEPHVHIDNLQNLKQYAFASHKEAIIKSDIIICLVKHSVFHDIPIELLSEKIVLDFCGLFYKKNSLLKKHNMLFWSACNKHALSQYY